MKKTAIIIGGGPAGLTAAWQLLKEDIRPIVLEADSLLGGIARTIEYHGNRMDLGGHRFFSKSDRINELWRDLMPLQGAPAWDDLLLERKRSFEKGGPDPEREDRVMLMRRRLSRIFFLRKFFDYPISLKLRTILNMGLGRTFYAGLGYLSALLFKRKERSLEDFYINRFGRPLYRMFFEGYTEKIWGLPPSRIAPDWGAQRVKGLSLTKAVLNMLFKPFRSSKKVETSLIDEFFYPKKGPGQLWDIMASQIEARGGEILREHDVCELVAQNGRIETVRARKSDGSTVDFHADYVLSSMPVKDLVRGLGSAVPSEIHEIAENLPYRDFMTVGLLLKKLKIKNQTKIATVNNIVPDCWIYIQEDQVKLGRLQIFNNWSPYMVAEPDKNVWMGLEYFCQEGDSMWEASDDDFIQRAIDEVTRIGVIEKEDVLDAVRIRYKKAYPAYFGSYSQFASIRAWLDQLSNLYCIGRNGQHRYNNMDHSMLTALEAVAAITSGKTDHSAIWNVNTEVEYHESK